MGCGALEPAVSALVKVQTGLAQVHAASYLRQADEISAGPDAATRGTSHPEVFVRARALRLWSERDPQADAWLAGALEGPLDLATLDVLGQERVGGLTRAVVARLLREPFMQSEALLAHARRFFPGFVPSLPQAVAPPPPDPLPAGLHDYMASVLVDFVAADPELDDAALAAALALAEPLGCAAPFEQRLAQDLKLARRTLARVKRDAASVLDKARAQHARSATA